jgi:hypothetical protein
VPVAAAWLALGLWLGHRQGALAAYEGARPRPAELEVTQTVAI